MTPYDVITVGRVGVDLYPTVSGVPLAEVETFNKYLGGTATNVAVAAARYGRRSAVVTKVGDDPFGQFVRTALRRFGVDDRFVGTDRDLRTPVVFCELHPPDHFPLFFYREPKAPDLNIRVEELDLEQLAEARILWTTGTALSAEPSRSAVFAAWRHRGRREHTMHDLDYRPMFWASAVDARAQQRAALEHVTVAVGNREEVAVAVGDGQPDELARRLLDMGVEIAIVKLGPEGVLVAGADTWTRVPPVAVDVVNGLGAGDAFGGALCHGLLAGWELSETVRFANAAGAYVAGQLACADAMPDESQVRALLGAGAQQQVPTR